MEHNFKFLSSLHIRISITINNNYSNGQGAQNMNIPLVVLTILESYWVINKFCRSALLVGNQNRANHYSNLLLLLFITYRLPSQLFLCNRAYHLFSQFNFYKIIEYNLSHIIQDILSIKQKYTNSYLIILLGK